MTLRGITWDHPRAYQPLEAFAAEFPGPAVSWDRQSLADFESRPITDLARHYDLMVIDHPGLGAAIAAGALQPLDQLVPAGLLASWQAASVGPTWRSYTLGGRPWAIPADAATQVSVLRPDLLDAVPRTWADVPGLARKHRVTLCLGGPHAFLMLLAMCAPGTPDAERPDAGQPDPGQPDLEQPDLLSAAEARAAVEILQATWREADQVVSAGDPVAVHEAMAAQPDLAYCPLVYGYASYARPAPGRSALRWADAPPSLRSARPGTVLGGTGLAVSALSAPDPEEILRFLTAFLAPEVQSGLVPAHAGQPAHVAAWDSPQTDRAWGGYYSSTRRSLEAAWVRPRHDGWIGLQARASRLVREAVTGQASPAAMITAVNDGYRALARPQTSTGRPA